MYEIPGTDIGLTQGDIFSDCPIVDWIPSTSDAWEPQQYSQNVIALTQACDLANQKAGRVQVAIVHDVNQLIATNVVKTAAVKDQIRTHRVFGLYFLPEFENYLPESFVDSRDVHTVPRELLEQSPRGQVNRAIDGRRLYASAPPPEVIRWQTSMIASSYRIKFVMHSWHIQTRRASWRSMPLG